MVDKVMTVPAMNVSPAHTGDIVLRTINLTKQYGKRVAVNNLNLEVNRGEIMGFLGPNGAGKTTTIRMALGLIAPTAGSVEILGQDIASHGARILPRVGALVGSGSLEQDSPIYIVAMEKEEKTRLVHHDGLGKRQRHAYKTSEALPQCVIPALHVSGLSRLFAHGCMLLLRDHRRVCCPEIREAVTSTIAVWDGLPQPLTRLFAPIPHRISDYLTRLAAQGNPNPGVVRFFEHKRPQFVQFQRRGSGIFWIGGDQGRAQGRKLSYFFLIHVDTVVREMPNVRVRPRKLLRS